MASKDCKKKILLKKLHNGVNGDSNLTKYSTIILIFYQHNNNSIIIIRRINDTIITFSNYGCIPQMCQSNV